MQARSTLLALAGLPCLPALAASPQQLIGESCEIVPGSGAESFSEALAFEGNTLVVGDPDHDQAGITDTGGAFVYEPGPAGTWVEVAELVTGVTNAGDQFGGSVAVDGDTAVVGAPLRPMGAQVSAGAAYVFERDLGGPDSWGLAAALLPGDSDPGKGQFFGTAVASWGGWVAVGTDPFLSNGEAGAVHVYQRDRGGAGAWGQTQKLVAATPTEEFGQAVALDQGILLVGSGAHASNQFKGAAFVFALDGAGHWNQVQELATIDPGAARFAEELAFFGDTIAVGAPGADFSDGAVYLFGRVPGTCGPFLETQKLAYPGTASQGNFGEALGLFAERLAVGTWRGEVNQLATGSVHLYERHDGTFVQAGELRSSDISYLDFFGFDLAVGAELAVVGAPNGAGGPTVPFIPLVQSMALDPVANVLYGAEVQSEQLVRFDPTSGAGTFVGGLNHVPAGLAFDPGTGTLYGSNGSLGLFTIDTTTAVGTYVGDLYGLDVRALAFDVASGLLYGLDHGNGQLLRIDPANAAFTVVGKTGVPFPVGLTFDAETGALYAFDDQFQDGTLFELDPATGASTPVWSSGIDTARFLADRTGAGLIHGGDDSSYTLLELQTSPASSAAIGAWGAPSSGEDEGSAYVFTLPTIDVTYCTAGVSASGCQAQLAAAGVASASAASGFSLLADSLEGAKDGLFFFGTSGRQASPWGNGASYQCVVPPVRRAGLLSGAGSPGSCDGAFVQDLNSLWCPSCPQPSNNPGAGAVVQAQLWYRDPQNTSNQTTSLSNAVEFCLAP